MRACVNTWARRIRSKSRPCSLVVRNLFLCPLANSLTSISTESAEQIPHRPTESFDPHLPPRLQSRQQLEDHTMAEPHIVVGFTPKPEERDSLAEVLGDIAKISYINDLADDDREGALRSADVFFGRRMAAELRPGEIEMLGDVKFIQEHGAGVDFM